MLEGLTLLPSKFEDAVKGTPAKEPVMLTLDDLEELGGYIAADTNHTQDKKKGKKLDAIFQKIQKLLGTHTDEEPPQTITFDDAMKSKAFSDNAVQVAEFAATALMAAESMGIKTKPLEHFYLSPAQREVLLGVPDISKSIKTKLKNDNASFTIAEVASMTMSLVETSIEGTPRQQVAALMVEPPIRKLLLPEIAIEKFAMDSTLTEYAMFGEDKNELFGHVCEVDLAAKFSL